jgi:hypothetical protein
MNRFICNYIVGDNDIIYYYVGLMNIIDNKRINAINIVNRKKFLYSEYSRVIDYKYSGFYIERREIEK